MVMRVVSLAYMECVTVSVPWSSRQWVTVVGKCKSPVNYNDSIFRQLASRWNNDSPAGANVILRHSWMYVKLLLHTEVTPSLCVTHSPPDYTDMPTLRHGLRLHCQSAMKGDLRQCHQPAVRVDFQLSCRLVGIVVYGCGNALIYNKTKSESGSGVIIGVAMGPGMEWHLV